MFISNKNKEKRQLFIQVKLYLFITSGLYIQSQLQTELTAQKHTRKNVMERQLIYTCSCFVGENLHTWGEHLKKNECKV